MWYYIISRLNKYFLDFGGGGWSPSAIPHKYASETISMDLFEYKNIYINRLL